MGGFKSNSSHRKGGVLDVFFISKNAVDNNFIKNLDVIVVTGTNSDHYLVTAVVDTAGLLSISVPLVKKNETNLKQINFELLRYDMEQSDIIQLVLQCQNLNDSIVVYNNLLSKILGKHTPLVEKYIKTSKTPWWNFECQNARRRRRIFKEIFGRTNLWKVNLNIMQHVNRLMKSGIAREKYTLVQIN